MSVTDPRIFQSIPKSITCFCLKHLHNFTIKYNEGYLRCLNPGGTIINYLYYIKMTIKRCLNSIQNIDLIQSYQITKKLFIPILANGRTAFI